jgi:hypothetical protein
MMDISSTKSKNCCFALIPVEWFPGELLWFTKCFYDGIDAVVLHKFAMEVSNVYTVGNDPW